MRQTTTGAAKRLIFSLGILTLLGGCAVYPSGYTYYSDYGQPAYVAQPTYVAPPVYAPPVFVAPPLYFNFGFGSRGYYHGGRGYYRGGRWRR